MSFEEQEVDRVGLLAYWIRERRDILLAKENGEPRPWTEDPILDSYRFTNVRREDDAVTKWIAKWWRDPYGKHPNLLAAMVLARMLNNPETLGELGFPERWDSQEIRRRIHARRNRGEKILNAAYLITTCGVKMDKVDYICDVADTVQDASQRVVPTAATLESYAEYLRSFKGLGSFLSAQVVADLKNTPDHPLRNAPDWWTWAAVGPGSLRGLQAVLGRLDITERHFLPLATTLYRDVSRAYGSDLGICMQDFQNCLCEFSKYWKAYVGIGTPKQRY